jgi:hypothetical protein
VRLGLSSTLSYKVQYIRRPMKMLRTMLVFIAGTVLAALGQQVLGITGMIVGSIAGIFVGYWLARRLMP